MAARFREHLRSNVIGYVALFVALSGVAYAGINIPANSVGPAQLKAGAVKGPDLATNAVTNPKLGNNAVRTAEIANGVITPAKLKVGGAFTLAGLPNFSAACGGTSWADLSANVNNEAGYFRDSFGIVHLRGTTLRCSGAGTTILTLPEGFQPASLEHQPAASSVTGHTDEINVDPDGNVFAPNTPINDWISLDGVTFRCAPSGQNGCP